MSQQQILVESLNGHGRKLRLAIVTETFPPEINGVSLTLSRMVEGLRSLGHELEIIRPAQAVDALLPLQPFEQLLTKGVPIPRYPGLRMGMPAKRRLVRHWAVKRPDVVHVATEGPLGWSAVNAALQLRIPVTSDFRTNFHTYAAHYGVAWLQRPITAYLRKFHNRCLFTTVPTDSLREELRALGFLRLTVLPRGIDTAVFSPEHRDPSLRTRWGAGPDDLVVLFVGRLAPEKNLLALLQAWETIRRIRSGIRLVIVGDGPLRQELKASFPDAIFAGARRGQDLAAHYASADLFAFPSLSETFGNVVLEAMASGLPCVCFDQAAAGYLMKGGVGGLLVDPIRPADFSMALRTLAVDARRRQTLAVQARQVALAENWEGVIARFEALLLQAQGVPQTHSVGNLAEDGRVSPLRAD